MNQRTPATTGVEPLTVTVEEASELTGLGKTSIYVLLNRGLVESRYFGRRRLIVYASLKAHVLAGLPEDPPEAA